MALALEKYRLVAVVAELGSVGDSVKIRLRDGTNLVLRLVEVQDVFDGSSAEAVDTLVVVTYDHQIAASARKKRGEDELRVVGVLILVNADVFEFSCVISAHLVLSAKKKDRLHNDIVEIKRV